MKMSAGAPRSIWRASALLAAYETSTRPARPIAKVLATSSSASLRLAAAKTRALCACAAGARVRQSKAARRWRMSGLDGDGARNIPPDIAPRAARDLFQQSGETRQLGVDGEVDARLHRPAAPQHAVAEGRDDPAAAARPARALGDLRLPDTAGLDAHLGRRAPVRHA